MLLLRKEQKKKESTMFQLVGTFSKTLIGVGYDAHQAVRPYHSTAQYYSSRQ